MSCAQLGRFLIRIPKAQAKSVPIGIVTNFHSLRRAHDKLRERAPDRRSLSRPVRERQTELAVYWCVRKRLYRPRAHRTVSPGSRISRQVFSAGRIPGGQRTAESLREISGPITAQTETSKMSQQRYDTQLSDDMNDFSQRRSQPRPEIPPTEAACQLANRQQRESAVQS